MTVELMELGSRKLELMGEMLELSRRQLLLVDLAELTPLLERKEALIARIRDLDREIESQVQRAPRTGEAQAGDILPWQADLDGLVESILENERTMEARVMEEHAETKAELQTLERQGQVKQYLESSRPPGRPLNLRR